MNRILLASLLLSSMASIAGAESWVEASPEASIISAVNNTRHAGWVKVGSIDIDHDGDEDVLLSQEYLGRRSDGKQEETPFLVYLNDGGRYLMSREAIPVFLSFANVEYRRLEVSGGRPALINYKKEIGNGCRVFRAHWVERPESGNIEVRAANYSTDYFLPVTEQDIVAENAGPGDQGCGLPLSEVLDNYQEMTAEEARKYFYEDNRKILEN